MPACLRWLPGHARRHRPRAARRRRAGRKRRVALRRSRPRRQRPSSYASHRRGARSVRASWSVGDYLNNELSRFRLQPRRAGRLRPGRPAVSRAASARAARSAPTLVYDSEGALVMAVGAAGGSTIPAPSRAARLWACSISELPVEQALGAAGAVRAGRCDLGRAGQRARGDDPRAAGARPRAGLRRATMPLQDQRRAQRTPAGWVGAADRRAAKAPPSASKLAGPSCAASIVSIDNEPEHRPWRVETLPLQLADFAAAPNLVRMFLDRADALGERRFLYAKRGSTMAGAELGGSRPPRLPPALPAGCAGWGCSRATACCWCPRIAPNGASPTWRSWPQGASPCPPTPPTPSAITCTCSAIRARGR